MTPELLAGAASEALAAAHSLPPAERARIADELASVALSLRSGAAAVRRDAMAEMVDEHGYEATAQALGITVRAVRRHVPAGQEQRPHTPAGRLRLAVTMYQAEPWTITDLAADVGVDRRTLARELRRLGLHVRGGKKVS